MKVGDVMGGAVLRLPELICMLLLFGVCSGFVGCRRSENPGDSAAPTKPFPAVAAIEDSHRDIIHSAMQGTESETAFNLLLEAAVKDGLAATPEAAAESLIITFPDDDTGLFVLKEMLARNTDNGDRLQTFCRKIRGTLPNTAVGAMAFDTELRLRREASDSEFLELCESTIKEDAETPRLKRTAMLRRAEYWLDNNDLPRAGLESIDIFRQFPEWSTNSNAQLKLIGNIERAGLFLEADVLAKSSTPAVVARQLLFPDPRREEATLLPHDDAYLFSIYLKNAPRLDIVMQQALQENQPLRDRVLFFARCARLSVQPQFWSYTVNSYQTYLDTLQEYVRATQTGDEELAFLASVNQCLINALKGVQTELIALNRGETRRAKLSKHQTDKTLEQLYDAHFLLIWSKVIEIHPDDPQAVAAALDRTEEFFLNLNLYGPPLEAYNAFLDRFKSCSLASSYLFRLAVFHETKLKELRKAAELYLQLVKEYPESEKVADSQLRAGLILTEAGDYEQGYLTLQSCVSAYPGEGDNTLAARYAIAVCEYELGNETDATAHLTEIVEKYPNKEMAGNSLFWLAMDALGKSQYPEARDQLKDFIDRYPNSRFIPRAVEMVGRLNEHLSDVALPK